MTQRASVDFPQPVSPTRPRVSPLRTSRFTPSTACTLPIWRLKKMPRLIGKCLTTFSTRSSVSTGPEGTGDAWSPVAGNGGWPGSGESDIASTPWGPGIAEP